MKVPATRLPSRAQPIVLHPETAGKTITVAPLGAGTAETVTRSPQGSFVFNRADKTGVYMARGRITGSSRSP